jgi:hypothetical protein
MKEVHENELRTLRKVRDDLEDAQLHMRPLAGPLSIREYQEIEEGILETLRLVNAHLSRVL